MKRYVRKKKQALRMNSEGYLPLEQPKGWTQVDFGEVRYDNGQGQLHTGLYLAQATAAETGWPRSSAKTTSVWC